MTPIPLPKYTGEGFRGEKTLQYVTIVGSVVLLCVSLYSLRLQIKNTSLQLKDFERKENERLSNLTTNPKP